MTKAELEIELEQSKQKIYELESDNYSKDEYITELENDLAETQEELENNQNGIKDIEEFITRLKVDNLYTEELENFIKYYLKCYNN